MLGTSDSYNIFINLVMMKGIVLSQSFVQFHTHIVFHTKNNKDHIPEDVQDELYAYLGGILKNLKSSIYGVN